VALSLASPGFVRAEPGGAPSDCTGDATLCLTGGRFLVDTAWRTASGASGTGHAVALTNDSGYFWFFTPENIELVVKTLDACAVNDHFWFFAAGLTDVEVNISVTDIASGEVRTYTNEPGTPFEPIQDTAAFADCGVVPLLVTVTQFQFSPGGPEGSPIRLQAGTTYRITFRSEDVGHGLSAIPALGIDGSPILPGTDYVVTVTPAPEQRGSYNFACTRFCGVGHGSMHGTIEVE